jgi:hypothetical protein
MANIISDTGFWIEYEEEEHCFIHELSEVINTYVEENNITTVYDFGCGKGDYLDYLTSQYPLIKATGFEGHPLDANFDNILKADLAEPLNIEPVDLVMSIEVGEHIPKEFEQTFIDNITNHATKHIILSWGIPGQLGNGHVNCQENEYVINEVVKRGWVFESDMTQDIRSLMPWMWIKDTIMLFTKADNN